MQTVYLSLGSNEGDRHARLGEAIAALRAMGDAEVGAVSGFYETAPLGMAKGAAPFLNCAVELRTALEPLELLDRLEDIEVALGRRSKGLYANRTVDIDILLYGDHIIALPRLTVPHPRMAGRRFVLAPLAEIAPQAIHPLLKKSIAALNELTAGQKVTRERQPVA